MGVSGSGKSTIGRGLAQAMGASFIEGDDFHCPSSIEKMSKGIPLEDTDRLPWLRELHIQLKEKQALGEDAVLACSALKESYRNILSHHLSVEWIYLKAGRLSI